MIEIRPWLNRLNFYLNRNPQIQPGSDYRFFIPCSFQTIVLLSADFEMAWAWRYDKSAVQPLLKAQQHAARERQNVPMILDVCRQFNIPITWATVGHLFLDHCQASHGHKHPEIPQVAHYEGQYWNFQGSDWFEHDPCSDYQTDPLWYAPDLIRLIQNDIVKHEIGCHSFSHINCRDEACSSELMRAELQECKRLAAQSGLRLRSFVHPGHIIGNLDILAQEGFTNFRTDYRNVLGIPKHHKNGLWELEQTAEFVFRREWPVDYHVWRYIEIIKRAIQSNTVCVFWFHPSFDSVVVEKIWPRVFKFLDEHREQVWITTHGKYIEWLNEQAII